MEKLLKKIYQKLGSGNIAGQMASALSGTEFNSLLLRIFQERSKTIKPAEVLKAFEQNRFVQPDRSDSLQSLELDLRWLKHAAKRGFTPLTLSPVTPLGTCSAVGGAVSQNKVLSSIRGTEVVSDATNVMILQIASELKRDRGKNSLIKYSTVHRHVRAQAFDNPDYSAHFSVFCLVSGGVDKGNYAFEIDQLQAQILLYQELLSDVLSPDSVQLKFYIKPQGEGLKTIIEKSKENWKSWNYTIEEEIDNNYYQTIRFKIYINADGQPIDIVDGGTVDWLPKLTGNRKHRALISGAGTGLLQKLIRRSKSGSEH